MSGTISPVVVGVDGAYTAIRAARWAAAVANGYEVPLHIVHADPYLGHNPAGAPAVMLTAADVAKQQRSSQAILQAAEHAVRTDFPNLVVTTALTRDPAKEALADVSRRARLLVLGCDDVSLGTALLVGSTTVAVAEHSACPVVAWRGDSVAPTERRIVLGVDDGDNSGAAIAAAFEFADRIGVGITAVHAWSTRRQPGDVTIPYLIDWDQVEDEHRQQLSEALAPWIKRYPNVDVTCVVDRDKPSRALLRHVDDAQLVVVGSRGRGPLAGAVLGSTSLNLLHHSGVPVMICRQTDVHN